LRDLSGRLLRAQDEERRRIARELHDGVGQLLAAINMSLSMVLDEKGDLPAASAALIRESLELVEQACRDIRTMSHLLHPPLLDEVGLGSALRAYVDGFAQRSRIEVRMEIETDLEELSRDLKLSLFRIVQECLTNVHRHANSPTAHVRVYRTEGDLRVEVQDSGRGVPSDVLLKISEGAGVGLRGIRERLRQFGGRLDVRSDEKGTAVTAIFSEHPEQMPTAEGATQIGIALSDRPPTKVRSARVLCIDDEKTGMLSRRLLLESAGHNVLEARSGMEGIRLFQSEKLDLVILDYWMSDMKGTAVAAELKRLNPSIPIIMLSGLPELPGETMGTVDYWLMKGSGRGQHLLDTVHSLLERRPA